MRWREFITLLIDAAAGPLVAHAQQLRKLPPNARRRYSQTEHSRGLSVDN